MFSQFTSCVSLLSCSSEVPEPAGVLWSPAGPPEGSEQPEAETGKTSGPHRPACPGSPAQVAPVSSSTWSNISCCDRSEQITDPLLTAPPAPAGVFTLTQTHLIRWSGEVQSSQWAAGGTARPGSVPGGLLSFYLCLIRAPWCWYHTKKEWFYFLVLDTETHVEIQDSPNPRRHFQFQLLFLFQLWWRFRSQNIRSWFIESTRRYL